MEYNFEMFAVSNKEIKALFDNCLLPFVSKKKVLSVLSKTANLWADRFEKLRQRNIEELRSRKEKMKAYYEGKSEEDSNTLYSLIEKYKSSLMTASADSFCKTVCKESYLTCPKNGCKRRLKYVTSLKTDIDGLGENGLLLQLNTEEVELWQKVNRMKCKK